MITWLIPAYKTNARWLAQCLDSVAAQWGTHEWECLVIADGDLYGDETPIAEFRDARFKLIQRQHAGIAASLNAGLELAQGDWLARIDADDWNAPDRLRRQIAAADCHGWDLVGSAMQSTWDDGRLRCLAPAPTWAKPLDALRERRVPCFHPTWLVKTAAVRSVGGWPTQYKRAEDFALQCLLSKGGASFGNVSDPLVFYRRHSGAVSAMFRGEQVADTERAARELLTDV